MMEAIKEFIIKYKYALIGIICAIFLITATVMYNKYRSRFFYTKHPVSGLSVSGGNVYISSKNRICVHSRGGVCNIVGKLSAKGIRGCKTYDGYVYLLDNSGEEAELIKVDPASLEIVTSRILPFSNSVSAFARTDDGEWIICDDAIYQFSAEFDLVGQWEYPDRINPGKIVDCKSNGDVLFISTGKKIYAVTLGVDDEEASIRRTIDTEQPHTAFDILNGTMWLGEDTCVHKIPLTTTTF